MAFDRLFDRVLNHVALVQMRGERVPRVRVVYELDAGQHAVDVLVGGEVVAQGMGATAERAAARAAACLRAWCDDQPDEIEQALAASLERAS